MKRKRLSYDTWKCILSKEISGKHMGEEWFSGYIGLIRMQKVNGEQHWEVAGKDIVVCDNGFRWLTVLPENDWYCMTAILNEKEEAVVWYIDMIAGQGIDPDGMPYFDDLYLDLVVLPDGTVVVDDMDELEEAFESGDITREQLELALKTGERLKKEIAEDMDGFLKNTKRCYEAVKSGT